MPRERLRLLTAEEEMVTYTCGIYPLAVAEDPSGKPMSAINVRCLEGVDPASLPVQHFDGRSR